MSSPVPGKLADLIVQCMDFPPTEHQFQLIQDLSDFTYRTEPYPLYLLRGYAGTGKTSVLGAFVKALTQSKMKVRLMAPTGRAAKVLSKRSSREAFTIHKVIYRRNSSVDESSGMSLAPNLFTNTVFIVDEASMIGDYTLNASGDVGSRNLLDDLFEFVYEGKNCRLILLGDQGQLPPVGSDYSPALDRKYLETHYTRLKIMDLSLTQVLRQASGSGILYNATMIRNLKPGGTPKFILSGFKDFIRLPGDELQAELEICYSNSGSDETILLTRSNKRANAYNLAVRGRILYYEETICSGDVLMVVKNNYYWSDDQTRMGFIANGELMKVVRVKRVEEQYGFEFARLIVRFPDYDEIPEMEVLAFTESLSVEGPSLSRERLRELFYAVEKDYMHEKNKRKRYQLILKDPYFNALQIKYAYAVTCHKAQGGQWENVFIDPGFLDDDSWNGDMFRWLYTALTRASKKVYLLNFPEKVFAF
jgi:exodeoxyribonuclease-5